MSHIVSIATQVRDPAAVHAACKRQNLQPPVHGTHKLFSAQVTGHGVSLPDWRYPVVCDTASGQVQYDNYGGHWGEQVHLDKFLQNYAVEKTKIEARRKGHTVTEQSLTDGSIKLTINA